MRQPIDKSALLGLGFGALVGLAMTFAMYTAHFHSKYLKAKAKNGECREVVETIIEGMQP